MMYLFDILFIHVYKFIYFNFNIYILIFFCDFIYLFIFTYVYIFFVTHVLYFIGERMGSEKYGKQSEMKEEFEMEIKEIGAKKWEIGNEPKGKKGGGKWVKKAFQV